MTNLWLLLFSSALVFSRFLRVSPSPQHTVDQSFHFSFCRHYSYNQLLVNLYKSILQLERFFKSRCVNLSISSLFIKFTMKLVLPFLLYLVWDSIFIRCSPIWNKKNDFSQDTEDWAFSISIVFESRKTKIH